MTTTNTTIHIDQIDSERLLVPIIGTTPLIVHNFGAKARQQMLDQFQGRKAPKVAKDPQREYEEAFYYLDDDYGFPVTAFKKATVGAARFYGKSVSMTALRQFLFFHGKLSNRDPQQLIRIDGEPKMREDVVRLPNKAPDLRYRPEFREWSAVLDLSYVRSSLTRESVLSLIDAGGLGVGVGEWRPEKGGEYGTYRVDTDKGIEVVS